MQKLVTKSLEQKPFKASTEAFRRVLGPFAAAARMIRMAGVFTDSKVHSDPFVVANGSVLNLTGSEQAGAIGPSFNFLLQSAKPGALARLRRVLLERRPTLAGAAAWGVGFATLATAVRLALDPVFGSEYPYITYFLGVALAGGLGGLGAGLIATALSASAAWFLFLPQNNLAQLEWSATLGFLVFVSNVSIGALCAAMLRNALWKLSEGEHRQSLLVQELNHRVLNNLATVQSIARQTARSSTSLQDFLAAFQGRVIALGRTHELLSRNSWASVDVRSIVSAEIVPYDEQRFATHGPPLTLGAAQAVSLGMIIHELATNSAKYGALSGGGAIGVEWRSDGGRGELIWREHGGPPVSPPPRLGFGSKLIDRLARGDLEGGALLDFKPEGLVATVRFRARPTAEHMEAVGRAVR
ncbi:sensor histidine kinase [Phenylobacterium sp. LjRoot225]|uniref:sensor histidine kinase n=1 Tax=Phenylobacterium sp. LjRoot225 TaxID=3342285 RepID=UPI003ECF068D